MSEKWDNGNFKRSESPSEPDQPKITYSYVPQPAPVVKKVKKVKHVYDPGHAPAMTPAMSKKCPPVVCPPLYCVKDHYVHREVPHIHPIVNVNRYIIVNVPKHYYRQMTQNVVIDPGYPY